MKAKELASMGTGELNDKLQELYVALQKDKAQAAAGTPPKKLPKKLVYNLELMYHLTTLVKPIGTNN